MTRVVQHEPPALRAARSKRCDEILAGNLRSLEFVSDLDLHNLQLGDERMARVIARIGHASAIKQLRIGFNVLGADAMNALAESALSAQLEHLDLTGNELGDAGIAELCAGVFPSLRQLDLAWCRLGDGAAAPLAGLHGMPVLRELSLRRNDFSDRGAEVLAASPMLRKQLTRIDVDYNDGMTRRGAAALVQAFGHAFVS